MEKTTRNTRTKQMVMSVLSDSASALCHDGIVRLLPEKIDRVTVYRILQGFCKAGKVHKFCDNSGKTYYALCHSCSADSHHDDHPHFHCVKCDTLSCVDGTFAIPKLPDGYSISDASCLISGYCPNCRQNDANMRVPKPAK